MWYPDWTGEEVLIVASGPSLTRADALRASRNRKCIVVNLGFKILPEADVLYGCDKNFWNGYPEAHQFQGLKITASCDAATQYRYLNHICVDPYNHEFSTKPGHVGSGQNGGFQAINLAYQFGCREVKLLGFDMGFKDKIHWHDDHAGVMSNPTGWLCRKWVKHFTAAAPIMKELGLNVVNLSPQTALKCFPREEIK